MKNFLNVAVFFLSTTALTITGFAGRNIADDPSVTVTTVDTSDPTLITDPTDPTASVDASVANAQNAVSGTMAGTTSTTAKNSSSGFSGGAMALVGIGALGAGIVLTKKGVVDKVANKVVPKTVKEAVQNRFGKKKPAAETTHASDNKVESAKPAETPKALKHAKTTHTATEHGTVPHANAEPARARPRSASAPRERMKV